MARKRKGRPISGWLAVDKPLGLTSTQVVAEVRRATGAAKVGHGGTLDPLASGVLPIALGEATKTVQYVMDGAKIYRWQVRWGESRATDDGEGAVTGVSDRRPTREQIEAVLARFTGEIWQVPPVYSAVKVAGERAYDLARAGAPPDLTPRCVRIDRMTLLDQPDIDHADFETVAGKGTYVRALARDIAQALGTLGYVSRLRRVACGPFHEGNAISLETLREVGQGPALRSHLLPVETALDDIPALALTEAEARRLQGGVALPLVRLALSSSQDRLATNGLVRAMVERRLVALARIADGDVRAVRVILDNSGQSEGVRDDVDHP